jgi:16S rRNA (guanine527-N7)-methyltransferase
MRDEDRNLLLKGLELLGIPRGRRQLQRLFCFLAEHEAGNARMNLTGAQGRDIIIKHVLDSLAAYHVLAPRKLRSIADVGSGGGFPGAVLAAFFTAPRFVLIERSAKKAAFLQEAVDAAGLENTVVKALDVREDRETYGALVIRALSPVNDRVYRSLFARIRPGGLFAAYKGRAEKAQADIESIRQGKAGRMVKELDVLPLQVPFLEAERHLLTAVRS